MDKIISHNIVETCKKLKIPYKSCNANYIEFYTDAQKLVQLYRDLIEISAKLQEISERHQIDGLNKLLHDDIKTLVKIDHDIIRLAEQFKNENV